MSAPKMFPLKLVAAALVGVALGASTHWLIGAFVFAALATVLTLRQIRSEVIEMRTSFPDADERRADEHARRADRSSAFSGS